MTDLAERDALIKAALDDPNDETTVGALADWFDEHGEPEVAAALRAREHSWGNPTNQSGWGAPRIWHFCAWCRISDQGTLRGATPTWDGWKEDPRIKQKCRAAVTELVTAYRLKEMDELAEYRKLKAERERWQYLEAKYGGR